LRKRIGSILSACNRRGQQTTQWTERDNGGLTAEIQGVILTLHPQSRGRWSIHARHVAEGPDGYSPSIPHWRSSLKAAKILAVLAVDETLDHIERIKAERGEVAWRWAAALVRSLPSWHGLRPMTPQCDPCPCRHF